MEHHNTCGISSAISYLLREQTHLVDRILTVEKEGEYLNHLQNLHRFRLDLSDGMFTGSISDVDHKLDLVEDTLQTLAKEGNSALLIPPWSTLAEMTKNLTEDKKKLESAEGQVREVFEWWLVPYWLSVKLEDLGEVVLRLFGCCWWGITSYEVGKDRQSILCKTLRGATSSA